MTWLIIALVVIVAVGPVMYLLPSKRDKRLAGLREEARKTGLNIRITHVPKLDPSGTERVNASGQRLEPKTSCVAYGRAVRVNLMPFRDLLLLKLPAQPTVPYSLAIDGWALGLGVDGASSAELDLVANHRLLQGLAPLLAKFPEDTLGVEITNRHIACLWRERAEPDSGVVADLSAVCQDIEQLLKAHVQRAAAEE